MLDGCSRKHAMFNQLFQINGKRTLITGATGAFGFDIASEFKKHGQDVTGLGRNDASLEKLKALGVNGIKLDINDESAIKDFCKSCDAFDNVILSHGIPGTRPMRMLSHDFSLNIIQTNLISTLDLLSNLFFDHGTIVWFVYDNINLYCLMYNLH